MADLFEQEAELEARMKQREEEIFAQVDGPKAESNSNGIVILTGLAIAVVLALPAIGIMAWKKGQTPAVAQTVQVQNVPARPIVWYYTMQEGLNAASITKKPIMIDFYTTWCGPCKMLDENTYAHPTIMSEAQNYISVKLNAEYYRTDAERYSISKYPTVIWADSAGNERYRITGAMGPDRFLPLMQQYR